MRKPLGQIGMQEYWLARVRHELKKIRATFPGKSLVRHVGDVGERSLSVDVGGINLDRSNLEFYEYHSLDELEVFIKRMIFWRVMKISITTTIKDFRVR